MRGGILCVPFIYGKIAEFKAQNQTIADQQRFGKFADDFNKSKQTGRPLRLDTKDTIKVVLENGFSEQDRQNIVNGINGLSEICPNIKYDVLPKYETAQKAIYFSVAGVENMSNAAGTTHIMYDGYSCEIALPIYIDLRADLLDAYWDTSFTNSALTTIVKHELMHTLGFDDIYDESRKDDTIMYYSLNPNVTTFTDEDVEKINYVYGDRVVATTAKPNSICLYPSNKAEDEEVMAF